MPFVNKMGEDGEDDAAPVAAGAPNPFDVDFDPNDPDAAMVHYNLTGWGFDQRAELSETLAERSVPHLWDGEELVVPEAIEAQVDALFDELEAEIGPFPVPLLDGEPSTEFGLDEWPLRDLETLKDSLIEAEIPHLWQGRTLLVAQEAEDVVDDLLDEDAAAPDGALQDLYVAADRLARDGTSADGRSKVLALVPELSPTAPPFGLAASAWSTIVGRAQALVEQFERGSDPDEIGEVAAELRAVCRPYV